MIVTPLYFMGAAPSILLAPEYWLGEPFYLEGSWSGYPVIPGRGRLLGRLPLRAARRRRRDYVSITRLNARGDLQISPLPANIG